MSTKHKVQLAAVAATLAAGLTGGAHAAEEEGWYGGLNLGRAHLGLSGADLDNRNAGLGVTSSSALETRDTTWSLTGGYRFNRHLAIEGGYVDLGTHRVSGTTSAPAAGGLDGRYKAHGYSLAAVGIVPLQGGFSLYGKAGLFFARTDLELAANSVALAGTGQSRTGGTLGLGMSYDFTRNVFGRAEWNRYARIGDDNTGRSSVDTWTIGVGYRF